MHPPVSRLSILLAALVATSAAPSFRVPEDRDSPRILSSFSPGSRLTLPSALVLAINDGPIGIKEDATDVEINVLENDLPDPDELTVVEITDHPENGTAVITSDGEEVEYTPNPNFNGSDQFDYKASDGTSSDVGTVFVSVTPVNDPPVANDGPDATTRENTPVRIDVLDNDGDPDGDRIVITDPLSPKETDDGSVQCDATSCTYAPDSAFVGTDDFEYEIADTSGLKDKAIVTITVTSSNRDPLPMNDDTTTLKNTPVTINVLKNDTDPDGDPLTVISVSDPPKGTALNNADSTVTYIPDLTFVGTDAFTYTVSDGRGGIAGATVSITVTEEPPPPNQPPNANNDSAATSRNNSVRINVLGNDSDPDGDPLTVAAVSDPPSGTASRNSDETVTYRPDPGFVGNDAFTYTISDGRGDTDGATVSVTVTDGPPPPPNQPPNATIDSPAGDMTIQAGQSVSFAGTGSDADGAVVAFTWSLPGGNPSGSSVQDPGSVTYASPGTFSATFNVTDDDGATDPTPATRTITVTPLDIGGEVGDLNVEKTTPGSEGRVDGHDVLFVLRAIATQNLQADVDNDGDVDQQDVQLVLAALGQTQ